MPSAKIGRSRQRATGMNAWIYLAVAILSEVIATSALKASEGFSKVGPSILVVFFYGVSFYCLSQTLKSVPVGVAYAIWSGVGIVFITLVAWVLHGQKIDLWGVIGMAMITGGVVVMNTLSKTSGH
ncbi:multidrug efflux SMR transporter [Stenotrophomonas aracearum]